MGKTEPVKFPVTPAPQWHTPVDTGAMMRAVLYALLPAIAAHIWFYGIGLLCNLVVASTVGVLCEASALRLRNRPQLPFLADGSTLVTAWLYALALPPLCPWWVTAIGMVFAILLVKHAYGGLGYNVFNPAMAGFVFVLVSFPEAMAVWPSPDIADIDYRAPDLRTILHYVATGNFPADLGVDAISRATVLDMTKEGLGQMRTMDEIRTHRLFGDFGGQGWEWIGNFTAIGGLGLLLAGVIRWQTPAAVLGGLLVPATLFWIMDPNTHPSPGLQLFGGGAIIGAFFIATDPVSSPVVPRARVVYGIGIGVLAWLIRNFGSYADGIAFGVLLMNAAAPLLDRWFRPQSYGQTSR